MPLDEGPPLLQAANALWLWREVKLSIARSVAAAVHDAARRICAICGSGRQLQTPEGLVIVLKEV